MDLPIRGRSQTGFREGSGADPAPQPRDLVYLVFCPNIIRAEPVGVKQVRPLEQDLEPEPEPRGWVCWKLRG